MKSLDEIRNRIAAKSKKEDRILRGIWSVDCLFYPSLNGRIFDYKFIVTQTLGQGCSYSLEKQYDTDSLRGLIGKDILAHDTDDTALQVALMDSIYGCVYPLRPALSETVADSSEAKMHWRSRIIYNEACRLLAGRHDKKIVNVGVVGDIIRMFVENGFDIAGTDFDETIVGRKMFDTADIYHGNKTLELVAASDLAIVTGMTIATETIDDIIRCCAANGTKLVVFAETGASFGQYFLEMGVDAYVSEPFPFYIFNGTSTINVYRKATDEVTGSDR